MKKLIKFSLLLALLLPVTAVAHDFEVEGIYYKIDGSNAIVTYQGEIYWQSHYHYTGDVILPSTVTYNAVTYSVTAIDEYAFFGSGGMKSVTIPESITEIGECAFGRCDGLTNVTIPRSVTSIGRNLFHYCYGLNSISVESGNSCYDSRDNCNAIIETATNTLITGCKNSIIPNTVTSIGQEAFQHCTGLTGDLVIPNSVTTIGAYSFYGCTSLRSVTIPNSITSIGGYSFYGCTGLTNVTLESAASNYGVFKGCAALSTVIVRRALPPSISVYFFDEGTYQSATLHVPAGRKAFFQEHNVWNKFANIVEEDMPDVEIDSSPFNNLYSRRLILSYTSREDGGGSLGGDANDNVVQVVKFPVERMMRIKGNEITHIRFNLWGRYDHVSNMKVFIGSAKDKRDLVCQSVTDLHEGWNEIVLDEPYLITGDSIFVGMDYHIGDYFLYPVRWDAYAGIDDGACLFFREGKWGALEGTWYIQCMVEGDQVPKYDLHLDELIEPLYNRAVKAGEPFEFSIRLRNWGSMAIDRYEMHAQMDGKDIECLPRWSTPTRIKRGGGQQEIPLKVIPSEGTPSGCYYMSVSPSSLNDVEYTSVEAPLMTPVKVYEHDMGRQKILVQVYSGTWCGYCVGFDSLVEQKRQERDDLAVVSIHSGHYSIPAGESYLSMLYHDGIPNVDLNRCVEKTPYNFRDYRMNYELDYAKAQPAFATVNIAGSFNEENHVLNVTVSGKRNEDFLPVEGWTNLTVLLVEDDVIGGQWGYDGSDYHHPAVLRAALSDVWGDLVEWDNDSYEMNYSTELDPAWNPKHLRVVAFLGKPFTGNNYEEIGVVNCNEYLLYDPYIGDVNGDQEVNIADINAVIGMILSGAPEPSGDANRDGEVNIADINVIIQAILNH